VARRWSSGDAAAMTAGVESSVTEVVDGVSMTPT
jgi:hypothetical protein